MTTTARLGPGAWRRGFIALLLLPALAAGPAAAQEEGPGPLFDGRDAWIASAYLGSAALAFPFDVPIARAIQDSLFQRTPGLKQAATGFNILGFPGSLILSGGLYGAGRIAGNDDMADVGLHTVEAIVMAEAATYLLKWTAGRARPSQDPEDNGNFRLFRGVGDDDYRSFPSGHASAGFAVAAALAHEMERLWGGSDILYGVITYGPASVVAMARMFDNRHWTSDVVFGAAIGAFSGWKVVKYNHDNPDNTLDDWFLSASVAPGDWSTLRLMLVPGSPFPD
jgi:membrane-associated phospholipid phosphatase